ncbi:MAG: phage holin family protein [Clostridia bacterium]|nr:phage holin family protein [Clostridia bacterium]
MNFEAYIRAELLILIPVMYLIGQALKNSRWKDEWIPLTLGGISVVLATLWVTANSNITGISDIMMALFAGITQGVLIAGASVFANQLCKQHNKKE